ncbi:3-methyl-2-oxobutanoate hydroxymethyltransferase [Caminibacter mediatlanticus TB-2]|uniref:3-methyl-2-oxobutanoate hydroxymethyltransferase n=1 Tax=Caminibacter mediatlanticus TB-2 TaxID=391592 RepID=A0AAI9AG97_9BACT|nr:3-methyl-2-oxobutanoate hydroxymethyltransferase [Caminibacter mediatlanticus]EDM23071.1 3-methyl-2-oxobutanoate hydroxymethyltransferase [Caminibacter mediatlanticus TB-2]QCT94517.1 3-methyl-2-oxobutanoate hydroxymethyltransferase [Caminibacter mediatlanticus TB-2]
MKKTLNYLNKQEKLTMITAYDALFAKIFDDIVDIILVGDSLNMSFFGESDTLSATLDQMIYHTKAVCNGAKSAYIVCDMPFGSYETPKKALESAIKIYKETKADAVKLEGGVEKAETIKLLTQNAIAVVGHIGLMPQFSRSEGGYIVKGKDEESKQKLIEDAKAIEEAGAIMLVIEGVKEEVAREITEIVNIPTIGIGAGRYTKGQVLVWSDMLGFFEEFKPKFVRRYLNGAEIVRSAVNKYVDDVKMGKFPSEKEIY